MISEVIANKQETPNTWTIRFKLEKKAEFKPGQFAMITLDNVLRNEKLGTERKPFSIASRPGIEYVDITVKKTGPFSTRLAELKPGEKAKLEFPFGIFSYTQEMGDNLVLIGAGSGIVPLMSIMSYNTNLKSKTKMRLIYSSKTEQDIIYKKELAELEKKNKNLKIFNALTQQPDWPGLKGRINEGIIKEIAPDYLQALFYICGPIKFVPEIQRMLLTLGVDKFRIRTERYD